MGRLALVWELGRNLGHLSRLAPLARRLEAGGHEVAVVVRDPAQAAQLLPGGRIRVLPAPGAGGHKYATTQPVSYANLLLSSGWDNAEGLTVRLRSWVQLFADLRPQLLVLDFAPTALLAARVLGLPCALLGTGFELPPRRRRLPRQGDSLKLDSRGGFALGR